MIVPPPYRPKAGRQPIFIVGLGGIGSGGRPRAAYDWTVHSHLPAAEQHHAVLDTLRLREMARMEGQNWRHRDGRVLSAAELVAQVQPEDLLRGMFIRRVPADRKFPGSAFVETAITEIIVRETELPRQLLPGWVHRGAGPEAGTVRIGLTQEARLFGQDEFDNRVSFGGFIPDGVLRSDPSFKGRDKDWEDVLRFTLFAFGDALLSSGVPMEEMARLAGPTRMGISFGSAQGGMGPNGLASIFYNYLINRRPSPTALGFSLNDMSAAFGSGYVLGPGGFFGRKSCLVQACNTFLANLEYSVTRIRAGLTSIEFAGAADFANTDWNRNAYTRAVNKDETVEGATHADWYRDASGQIIYTRASNPCGQHRNGFVMSEGAYGAWLMDAEMVFKTGAKILGIVDDVATFSDGPTKDATRPGGGLYFALEQILGSLEGSLGSRRLQSSLFEVAHEASTKLGSREITALNRTAARFGMTRWPVTAPKSFWGHSEGAAGFENLLVALFGLKHGVVPRIRNLRESGIGEDISEHDRLDLLMDTLVAPPGQYVGAVIDAMGFGAGNGAAGIISEHAADRYFREIVLRETGLSEADYDRRLAATLQRQRDDEQDWFSGGSRYRYTELEFPPDQIAFTEGGLRFEGRPQGAEILLRPPESGS